MQIYIQPFHRTVTLYLNVRGLEKYLIVNKSFSMHLSTITSTLFHNAKRKETVLTHFHAFVLFAEERV